MSDQPNDELLVVDTSDELRELALNIATDCRRTLDITSRHLDPAIYDQTPFVEAVKQIALSNRMAQIRIIVNDVGPVVSRGHRLIELALRLSSFISVRKPGRDHRNFNEAILVADNRAYIHRRFADRFEATACYDDIRVASDLTARFEEIWERAEIDSNFRRLHI